MYFNGNNDLDVLFIFYEIISASFIFFHFHDNYLNKFHQNISHPLNTPPFKSIFSTILIM